MENAMVTKRRRLEHQQSLTDGSSFPMEDLPERLQVQVLCQETGKNSGHGILIYALMAAKTGPTDKDSVKVERAMFVETGDSIIQQHSGIWLNKFSIRCNLRKDSDILDRWICFATASKAKVIDMNLWASRNRVRPAKDIYSFPLETFGAQDRPFIQYLFLTNVSKPHSDMCGFTKLRSLHLHCVQIIGDLSGLLLNCSSLVDLEVIECLGMVGLDIPHQLNKLRHLLISNTSIQMLELHVPVLSHFGYKGTTIPIVLHGCSKLQKATLSFAQTWREEDKNKILGHMHTLTPRATSIFMNLRHMTYEVLIFTRVPNSHSAILQLAQYLAFAPQLETFELHMLYQVADDDDDHLWHGEAASYPMPRHDHLKTVYMSGFRCYRPQVELLCCILEMGAALENVIIEPMMKIPFNFDLINLCIPEKICEWAHRTSQRFGKAITIVQPHDR
uniref:At1g61320/AtMIF1 LRR domain-containing protein n=1 Tax=Leersia perrieri TaxID=77586 RepID=A0A0D9WU31_9ORYZ